MNFTREPIVETIITPKQGFKLVLRNSKGGGQEEYFVDAVEVVIFGKNCFFRSLEKPKSFLLPVNDYEVLEVRETRMVLKTATVEKVKIGGGKKEKVEKAEKTEKPETAEKPARKRRTRKRKTEPKATSEESSEEAPEGEAPVRRSLLPPPETLISETITRIQPPEEPSEPPKEEAPAPVENEESEV